jgi:transposase-like protein
VKILRGGLLVQDVLQWMPPIQPLEAGRERGRMTHQNDDIEIEASRKPAAGERRDRILDDQAATSDQRQPVLGSDSINMWDCGRRVWRTKVSTTTTKPPYPNPDCPAPHVVRNGTLGGRQRYRCRGCGAWFGETHNTPMYRLRTPPEEIGRAHLVVMRRGSLRAAEEITGHKYETIGRWLCLLRSMPRRLLKCWSTISGSRG